MRKLYKTVAASFLAVVLLLGTVDVSAAQIDNGAAYSIETNTISGWPQGPDIYSETAVLMEAETGTILYNRGMNELRYPASITKIMTALLAIENCSMDEQVTFTEVCLADQAAGSGNAGMIVGETITMKECLLLLMVQSANDVATQIADYVGGSVEEFANMMNQRAQELGCKNTHFVNASGMPDENHYTTAYDMALIFQEAIKNDSFREIISTVNFTIGPTNMSEEVESYHTHHALFAPGAPEFYEGCFGGKTGITDASRNTLVSGAERDGMTLIAVTLRASAGEVCYDQTNMFNYGYDNFEKVEVDGGSVIVPKGTDLTTLTVTESEEGDTITKDYFYNETYYVGTGVTVVPTPEPTQEVQVTEEPQEETTAQDNLEQLQEENEAAEENLKAVYQYIIYILLGLIVVSLIITITTAAKKRKKRRNKRR